MKFRIISMLIPATILSACTTSAEVKIKSPFSHPEVSFGVTFEKNCLDDDCPTLLKWLDQIKIIKDRLEPESAFTPNIMQESA